MRRFSQMCKTECTEKNIHSEKESKWGPFSLYKGGYHYTVLWGRVTKVGRVTHYTQKGGSSTPFNGVRNPYNPNYRGNMTLLTRVVLLSYRIAIVGLLLYRVVILLWQYLYPRRCGSATLKTMVALLSNGVILLSHRVTLLFIHGYYYPSFWGQSDYTPPCKVQIHSTFQSHRVI